MSGLVTVTVTDPDAPAGVVTSSWVALTKVTLVAAVAPNNTVAPLTKLLQVRSLGEDPPRRELDGHVIIAGYGFAGRQLARSLRACDVPYVVVDLNVENVRLAIRDGVRAFFGDVTSPEVLEQLGITNARELAVTINDPDAARRSVSLARSLCSIRSTSRGIASQSWSSEVAASTRMAFAPATRHQPNAAS